MTAAADARARSNVTPPERMKAWVLHGPGELSFEEKPVPAPERAEVLVRIDAVACHDSAEYREAAAFRRGGAGEVELVIVQAGEATPV